MRRPLWVTSLNLFAARGGISLASQCHPEMTLHPLPPILRSQPTLIGPTLGIEPNYSLKFDQQAVL